MNKLWSDFVREEIKSPEFAIQYLIAAYLDDDKKSIDIAFRDVIAVYANDLKNQKEPTEEKPT